MPIKSDNFDLRGHIESAGHQLDLCKHVQITSGTCQGFLQKLTNGKLRNSWHKRWFVFDRQMKKLSYGEKHQIEDKGTHMPFKVRFFFKIQDFSQNGPQGPIYSVTRSKKCFIQYWNFASPISS